MKIALVTACYKPVINGVTRMVELLAHAFWQLGHQPLVFTVGPPQTSDKDEPFPIRRSPGWPLGRSGYYFTRRFSTAISRELSQMDIIHTHHLAMSIELIAKLRLGKPLLFTNHTRYDKYLPLYLPLPHRSAAETIGNRLVSHFWPRRANLADHIISPTANVAEIMVNYGVTKPISIIPNGIALPITNHPLSRARFGWGDHHTVLIYTGRLAAEKNIILLIRQFAIAQKKSPDLKLLILGDGPQRSQIEGEIAARKLGQTIRLTGEVPFGEVSNYLAAADFFVTASDSEVDPLTVVEAMASGLPVIALEAGWTTACLPDQGSLVANNKRDFAQLLVRAGHNQIEREKLSDVARKYSAGKTIQQTARLTAALYQTLIVHK
jgi:glycosyltransferase involved in cell wall biosynthesis